MFLKWKFKCTKLSQGLPDPVNQIGNHVKQLSTYKLSDQKFLDNTEVYGPITFNEL